MPFHASSQRQYTRMAVLNFLNEAGIAVEKPTTSILTPDQRMMHLRAIGLNYEVLEKHLHTSYETPKLYRVTGPVMLGLCFLGVVLLFIDLYIPFSRLNSVVYITWCLCSLSLYFTNRIALKDWKKRHGQK